MTYVSYATIRRLGLVVYSTLSVHFSVDVNYAFPTD